MIITRSVSSALTRASIIAALAIGLAACPIIAPYNPIAYQNATSLKVESLAMVDKTTSSYSDHKSEAEALQIELDKAYEFAKGIPKNELTTKQWAIVRDPDGHSMGGVLKRWQTEGKLSATFAKESGAIISRDFDQVIQLESAKIKN